MIRNFLLAAGFVCSCVVFAQPNCNALKWKGDQCGYEACKFLEESPKFFQLRKEFHAIYDKALELCPTYSDAYRAKSVAYLKTGDFITWKRLMDQAVELAPEDNLGYRGWCRFQFFRDYEGAIADIERLERLVTYDIGYSQNGTYHLMAAKALCYKQLGKVDRAVEVLTNHIGTYQGGVGIYDYLHLGVLHLNKEDFDTALNYLSQQVEEYDCAENRFYLGKTYQQLNDHKAASEQFKMALELYQKGQYMFDPYTHQVDKVYAKDIEHALKEYANIEIDD